MGFETDRRSSDQEDALLAALLQLHRRRTSERARSAPASSYGRILEHFERRGQRLAGERLITSQIVERLFESTRALPSKGVQQELEIVGRAGGSAAGRFRVTNRSAATATFAFVVGEPAGGSERAPLTFDPPAGELAPGATALVRVEADLRGWRPAETVTLPVECRWPGGRDRLWLVVSSSPPPNGAP
jgi:hypothetical protein